ncbi:MAG TPA: patatin-like phospholipase family protein [Actinomycetota bacterium]|jgi:NTE family protein|nr:patatin-like phospholipase family protein [Actinomycetota bacterium]
MKAFVLSGGGNLGAGQVGAVLALLERGIQPDLLVGTSAGAINAAYLAGDPGLEGARRLADIWTSVRTRDVFRLPMKPWHLLAHLRSEALYHSDGLRRLLEGALPFGNIEDAPLQLRIVATDFETGGAVAFHSGSIVDAVLASSALPGLFPPVEVGGRLYVDGGIADNVPISPAVGAGAKEIYVVRTGFDCPVGPGRLQALDVLWRSIGLLLNRALADDVRRFRHAARIVVLPSPCLAPTPIWNLSRSRSLIAEAHGMAAGFLDAEAA